MDYIREELLRQNRILAALMSVTETPEDTQDPQEESRQTISSPGTDETNPTAIWRRRAVEELSAAGVQISGVRNDQNPKKQPGGDFYAEEAARTPLYVVPQERTGSRETADIRDVSRCIQRDARRYDGGFSIY